jgi:hypothetical protein
MLQDVFTEMQGRSFANLADAQRFLDAQVHAYNTRPQRELGGLTPTDMFELLNGDWETSGALTVNSALGPDEIGDPELLHNARVLLTTLRDDGPAKATAGGNLAREFVTRVLPRLRWSDGHLDDVRRVNKVINEVDVGRLMTLRYVLAYAGLIHRRKGFHISPAGRRLLDDARRGELLALLVRTFFRRLDLRDVDGSDREDGLQSTIAFTLWKLRAAAAEWVTPSHLVDVAWLESAKDPLPPDAQPFELESREWCFRHRVLDPLVAFGVLESRDLPSPSRWLRRIEVRTTALYDRLFLFRFGRSTRG